MHSLTHSLLLVVSLLLPSGAISQEYYKGHFVDAYSVVDGTNKDPKIIIKLMRESGVNHAVLAPKGGGEGARSRGGQQELLANLVQKFPNKITSVTIVNIRKYRSDHDKFEYVFNLFADDVDHSGIAETPIYVGTQDYRTKPIIVPFDDHRVHVLTDAARSEKWPMHLWINFSDIPDSERNNWMQNFNAYLKENRDVTFLLMHLGTLPSNEIVSLISEHPNLYFLLSRTTPDFEAMETKYTMILDQNGSIKPDWKTLFVEHSDRFLVAFYTFGIDWSEWYPRIVYVWRNIMAELPEKVAHALAHGNAERIYNIKVENKNIANAHLGSNVKNHMSVSGQ